MTAQVGVREHKEQLRMDRHRQALDVALRMVTEEGLASVTMQRIADELGCGIGTLYRSFPSKGALIAELQREALDLVNTSLQLSQANVNDWLATRGITDPKEQALIRAMAAARFWVAAETVFQREVELSRRIFTDPAQTLDDSEGARIVPAGMRLLDLARSVLDDAVEAGALRAGRNIDRAVVLVAGTTGVLMTSVLERWDDTWFDGRRLAWGLVRDLFSAWGADRSRFDDVDAFLAAMAEHGQLIPPVRR